MVGVVGGESGGQFSPLRHRKEVQSTHRGKCMHDNSSLTLTSTLNETASERFKGHRTSV